MFMMTFSILINFFLLFQASDHANLKSGLAISGYDPVSYFQAKGPEEGLRGITVQFQGATYRFVNEANKALFEKQPEKYVPAYGGWCAYAMGVSGDKVKVDPETFKIVDNKLLLFYNFWGNNTLKPWNEDESALRRKADEFWGDIVSSN